MHEFSIAEEIVDVVGRTLGGPKPVQSVQLTLGTLSNINAEALQFCFTEVAEQSGFGRPELKIITLPAQVRCRDCGLTGEAVDFTSGCSGCRSFNRDILSGYECVVDSITFEES